jgi:hypothetical protein
LALNAIYRAHQENQCSSSTDIRTRMIGEPVGIWIKINVNLHS